MVMKDGDTSTLIEPMPFIEDWRMDQPKFLDKFFLFLMLTPSETTKMKKKISRLQNMLKSCLKCELRYIFLIMKCSSHFINNH